MSRTDATRPFWLREWTDGEWDHDHRDGECRPETFESVRKYAAGARHRPHWWRDPKCGRWKNIWEPPRLKSFLTWTGDRYERTVEEAPGQWTRILDPKRPCKICDAVFDDSPTCERKLRWAAYFMGNAPRWYRNNLERGARNASRIDLRNAMREWNAEGDTEIQPEPYRHRHNANWYWW